MCLNIFIYAFLGYTKTNADLEINYKTNYVYVIITLQDDKAQLENFPFDQLTRKKTLYISLGTVSLD